MTERCMMHHGVQLRKGYWTSLGVVTRSKLGKVGKDLRTNLGRDEIEGRTSTTFKRLTWKGKGIIFYPFMCWTL